LAEKKNLPARPKLKTKAGNRPTCLPAGRSERVASPTSLFELRGTSARARQPIFAEKLNDQT